MGQNEESVRRQSRSKRSVARLSSALGAFAVSLLALGANLCRADDGMHTFRLEGGPGFALTQPPANRFDVGGGGAVGYELRPVPWVGFEARFSAYVFPSSGANPTASGFGTYFAPGLGVRIHPLATLGVSDLWLAGAAVFAFTGSVVRPGVEVGIGYEFDVAWWLRIGPFVRYHHVFQTVMGGADGGFLSVGLSLAFGGDQPVRDRDGDGVLDAVDHCPTEPEDVDSFEDADGCPDPDNDADGIPDAHDACPLAAEDHDGFEDGDGCPDVDNDHDGILDSADHCPDVAEDVDGFQDDDGCPDPDDDGDGILDAQDACPSQPETPNGFEDTDGCPDAAPLPPVVRAEYEVQLDRLGERLQFPQNQSRILAGSRAALREVIALLREHSEITRMIIEAYASAEGAAEANMLLSQRRAEAIVGALVLGGVARSRLVVRAFGEARPEVSGDSEEEHAANRRVVFIVEHEVEVPAGTGVAPHAPEPLTESP